MLCWSVAGVLSEFGGSSQPPQNTEHQAVVQQQATRIEKLEAQLGQQVRALMDCLPSLISPQSTEHQAFYQQQAARIEKLEAEVSGGGCTWAFSLSIIEHQGPGRDREAPSPVGAAAAELRASAVAVPATVARSAAAVFCIPNTNEAHEEVNSHSGRCTTGPMIGI